MAAGVSWLPIRGVALNPGHVWLLTKTLSDGESIGHEPVSGTDPFTLGNARAWFAGVSCNFKQGTQGAAVSGSR